MMTCTAMGLLLRISYELDRARRQRGERTDAPRSDDAGVAARDESRPSAAQAAARIGGRRIEPKAGAPA